MKRTLLVAVVSAVVAFLVVTFLWNKKMTQTELERQRVAQEVAGVVGRIHNAQNITAGKPSSWLLKKAKEDPELVMAFYILAEAKHFPGVPEGTQEEVLDAAKKNSAEAMEAVRRTIYKGLVDAVAKNGRPEPWDSHHIGWINNNTATADAFLEWPLAVRLGKEAECVVGMLEGTYREKPYWQGLVTEKQIQNFWWGDWPFEGEEFPYYEPANI